MSVEISNESVVDIELFTLPTVEGLIIRTIRQPFGTHVGPQRASLVYLVDSVLAVTSASDVALLTQGDGFRLDEPELAERRWLQLIVTTGLLAPQSEYVAARSDLDGLPEMFLADPAALDTIRPAKLVSDTTGRTLIFHVWTGSGLYRVHVHEPVDKKARTLKLEHLTGLVH